MADVDDVTLAAGFFKGDKPQYPFHDNVTYRLFPAKFLIPGVGFSAVGSFVGLRTLFREIGAADVVHVSFSREFLPFATVALASLLRKPIVLQPHGMLTARTSRLHRIVDLVTRPLFRRARAVIALTSREATALESWIRRGMPQAFNVGNPRIDALPPMEVRTLPNNEALFLARLEPRKRLIDFAEAASIAAVSGFATSYCIVGPDQGDLQNIKETLDTTEHLTYEGPVPAARVGSRLSTTGVFVLPSYQEPWGNVLVLALSMGIPVVVTRSAALACSIAEFGAGRIVDDQAPAQISAAVADLLGDPRSYDNASKAALALTSKMFDESAIRRELERAYSFAARKTTK